MSHDLVQPRQWAREPLVGQLGGFPNGRQASRSSMN
jgi:hypothetical protein